MISIVIPLFNEEESLPTLYAELLKVAPKLDKSYEIIFVDDGSTDNSRLFLEALVQKDKHVHVFSFKKNRGKAEALTFGFQKATGDYVVTLDADLQDKPTEIHKLLVKAKEGWDVVCGWRKNRKDSVAKVIASRFFNSTAGSLWGLPLHDYNCGLKVFTNEAAKSLNLYGGLHRFIPLLVHQQGFRVSELAVEHAVRKYGKSKYGISKLWRDFPDMFTMLFLVKYAKHPLHFFGVIGMFLLTLGVIILGYLVVLKFMGQGIGDRPILFLGMLLVISGLQTFFTGFLADLIVNSTKNAKT